MTIKGIFDRAKAIAKIKFDAETASVPSGDMIVRSTRNGTLIERFENRLSDTRSDEDDEEMGVMRPVDSFFDRTKPMTISTAQLSSIKERYLEIIAINSS